MFKIAIIGGGVAGSTVALYLANLGYKVTLFERNRTLIGGPPFCHLHAGGSLYPQITDTERVKLLKESIEFARFYPFAVDHRPTLITTPAYLGLNPLDVRQKMELIEKEYGKVVKKDAKNAILGERYYKHYTKDDLKRLKMGGPANDSFDEWMRPASRLLDMEQIKDSIFITTEYGLNIFALSGALNRVLKEHKNVNLRLQTQVRLVEREFDITYTKEGKTQKESFDFLINAAGFESGWIDEMLGYKRERMVEFKAAYLVKWNSAYTKFPEIIFHGERGTKRGMGQLTPYGSNLFQLHYMSKEATLFEEGLVKGDPHAKLPKKFLELIESDWERGDYKARTYEAVKHISRFIPSFKETSVAAKPLFGAQQIPGSNPELRAADVSFEGESYARCEPVKASSVIEMSRQIAKKISAITGDKRSETIMPNIHPDEKGAKRAAQTRGYPKELAAVRYKKSG